MYPFLLKSFDGLQKKFNSTVSNKGLYIFIILKISLVVNLVQNMITVKQLLGLSEKVCHFQSQVIFKECTITLNTETLKEEGCGVKCFPPFFLSFKNFSIAYKSFSSCSLEYYLSKLVF